MIYIIYFYGYCCAESKNVIFQKSPASRCPGATGAGAQVWVRSHTTLIRCPGFFGNGDIHGNIMGMYYWILYTCICIYVM